MQTDSPLQEPQHLSKAFIWGLQAKYYQSLGIDAWLSGTIPSRVTTNSHLAWRYARLIASYLADVGAKKATIVELGAGHGRFAFLCASHLRRMLNSGPCRELDWRYVLTDVADRNIEFWETHDAFSSLRAEGKIDFARFEAGIDNSLNLRISRDELSAEKPSEHMVVIANYFFDSLPMDVWETRGNELHACYPQVLVNGKAKHLSQQDHEILEHITFAWKKVKPDGAAYANPEWNHVVDDMAKQIGSGTFMMPLGAFQAIETLESWCAGPMMVLATDKGYPNASYYRGRGVPEMVHHGCFSFNVNFAALESWFHFRGGTAILPSIQHGLIEVAAMVSNRDKESLPRLCFEADTLEQFSPDEYHRVTRRCEENELDLGSCLGLIKLSCYEPLVLYRLRRSIRANIPDAGSIELEMLHEVLRSTYANYYHLNECDLPFAIGAIYHVMGEHELALKCFLESLNWYGEDAVTLQNLAICQKELGQIESARTYIQRCLQLAPLDANAIELRDELELLSQLPST
jgi:hypothetical protein